MGLYGVIKNWRKNFTLTIYNLTLYALLNYKNGFLFIYFYLKIKIRNFKK